MGAADTEGRADLGRLRERLRTFVELSGEIESTCLSLGREAATGRAERCRNVARRARELGEQSRALLGRLEELDGRSRLRVLLGLFLTRGRQRSVASLASDVAAEFQDVVRTG